MVGRRIVSMLICFIVTLTLAAWIASIISQILGEQEIIEYERRSEDIQQQIDDLNKKISQYKTLLTSKKSQPRVFGPGENGERFVINVQDLDETNKKMYDAEFEEHGFNGFASDMISLHRTLPESILDDRCKALVYPSNLPNVSVIIPFKDESWSVLLRTVHSVLERSDSKLLKEIILVDDFSRLAHLKVKLDIYLRTLPNVTVVRLPKSSGLMMARQAGIARATSEIIVTMDSHIEVADGWLKPLVYPISRDNKVLTFPGLDGVNKNDFRFTVRSLNSSIIVPTFDFQLGMSFSHLQDYYEESRKDKTKAILSPTIQGWMFAMNRKHFWNLGGFDPGMDKWGGEQMELSFKVWMCGGRIEMIPCSHAAHIFRNNKWKNIWDVYLRNNYRVADTWMDQYAVIYKEKTNYSSDAGDITERKAIRQRLQCKSFDWYLDTIQRFVKIYVPRNRKAKGVIKNKESELCLRTAPKQWLLAVETCRNGFLFDWDMSEDNEIRHNDHCLDVNANNNVTTKICSTLGDKSRVYLQAWTYHQDGSLIHKATGQCLSQSQTNAALEMVNCSETSLRQKWQWTRITQS